MRWSSPLIAHRRRGPRSGHYKLLQNHACGVTTAAPHLWSPRPPQGPTIDADEVNEAIASTPPEACGLLTARGPSSSAYLRVRAETQEPPRGNTTSRKRRCTNEAVRATRPRATRPSEFDGRSRPAGPDAFHRIWAEGLTKGFAAGARESRRGRPESASDGLA